MKAVVINKYAIDLVPLVSIVSVLYIIYIFVKVSKQS